LNPTATATLAAQGRGWPAMLLSMLLGALMLPPATTQCPNSCSGHGECGANNVCDCFDGYDVAADCSMRRCPYGVAWADKAYALDKAHTPAECSNAGICEAATGICTCFDGYTGIACQRSTCPNDCSGNGICMTIQDLGKMYGLDYLQPGRGGDGVGPEYSNWDRSSITVCNCDAGFFGPDCSRIMCPKTDDPVSINQNARTIKIDVISNGAMQGDVAFFFNGYYTTFSADAAQMNSRKCEEAFEALENVDRVACDMSRLSTGASYNVSFLSFPQMPQENNLFSHSGNPPLTSFTCDISGVLVSGASSMSCNVTDTVTTNIKEYAFCANRGNCDFTSGVCYCIEGYTGIDCTSPSYSATAANALPGAHILTTGADFSGEVCDECSNLMTPVRL
jgi:hypothetical protein